MNNEIRKRGIEEKKLIVNRVVDMLLERGEEFDEEKIDEVLNEMVELGLLYSDEVEMIKEKYKERDKEFEDLEMKEEDEMDVGIEGDMDVEEEFMGEGFERDVGNEEFKKGGRKENVIIKEGDWIVVEDGGIGRVVRKENNSVVFYDGNSDVMRKAGMEDVEFVIDKKSVYQLGKMFGVSRSGRFKALNLDNLVWVEFGKWLKRKGYNNVDEFVREAVSEPGLLDEAMRKIRELRRELGRKYEYYIGEEEEEKPIEVIKLFQ